MSTCASCRHFHETPVQLGVKSDPFTCDVFKLPIRSGNKACAKFESVRKPKPDVQGTLLLEDPCAHSFFPPVGRGPRCHLAGDGMVCNSGHKPAQWCKPGACPRFKAAS